MRFQKKRGYEILNTHNQRSELTSKVWNYFVTSEVEEWISSLLWRLREPSVRVGTLGIDFCWKPNTKPIDTWRVKYWNRNALRCYECDLCQFWTLRDARMAQILYSGEITIKFLKSNGRSQNTPVRVHVQTHTSWGEPLSSSFISRSETMFAMNFRLLYSENIVSLA